MRTVPWELVALLVIEMPPRSLIEDGRSSAIGRSQ